MSAQQVESRDRQRACTDLTSSLVVEAGAGTGKTTTMISRILTIVADNPPATETAPTALAGLVAITFTEKAAGELKVRLRSRLEEMAADEADPRASIFRRALEDLALTEVSTIHSFCARLLRERPVEAGVDPGFEIADQLRSETLFSDAWDEWIEQALLREDERLRVVISVGRCRLDVLRPLSRKLLDYRDIAGVALFRAEDRMPAVDQFLGEVQDMVSGLEAMIDAHCKSEEDSMRKAIAGLMDYLNNCQRRRGHERAAYILHDYSPPSTWSGVGRKANWDGNALAEARARGEELSQRITAFKKAIGQWVLANANSLAWEFCQEYDCRKQEESLLDFHDLLLKTRDMLRDSEEARTYFKQRFRYLLVDEFQDTDPLQAEIVFYLAEREGDCADDWREVVVAAGKLFIVGDPKQSIYRFRRADIEMFEESKELLREPEAILQLTENFRSATPIVEVVNAVFGEKMQAPDDGKYQPNYTPIIASRAPETLPPEPAVRLLTAAGDADLAHADDARREEARSIAALVKQRILGAWQVWDSKAKQVIAAAPHHVALLFRKLTNVELYEQAFQAFGIPYSLAGGKNFYARQEVKSLRALLSALDCPEDTNAVYAALKSVFFGLSDADLLRHWHAGGSFNYMLPVPESSPEAVREAYERLRKWRRQIHLLSIVALLERIYAESPGLEVFYLKPGGAQRVANLWKVIDDARAFQALGATSFRRFARWVADLESMEESAQEPPAGEDEAAGVQMLTIHKAKGLEWPVVILTDCALDRDKGRPFIVTRENPPRIYNRIGRKTSLMKCEGYSEADAREKAREQAEELRLLYVAMTRARDHLVIPWGFWGGRGTKGVVRFLFASETEAGEPHAGLKDACALSAEDLNLDLPEAPPFRATVDPDAQPDDEAQATLQQIEAWKQRRSSLLDRMKDVRRPTAITRLVHEEEAPVEPSTGVRIGNLTHHLLEHVDLQSPDLDAALASAPPNLAAEAVIAETAREMAERALATEVMQRAAVAQRTWREMPLNTAIDGQPVSGAVDLMYEEAGGLVIVDFKTDDFEECKKEKLDGYRRQVALYAETVAHLQPLPVKEAFLLFLGGATRTENVPIGG